MVDFSAASAFLAALEGAREEAEPFRHWMLRDVLDPDTLEGLKTWPHEAPSIRYDHGCCFAHYLTAGWSDYFARLARLFPGLFGCCRKWKGVSGGRSLSPVSS